MKYRKPQLSKIHMYDLCRPGHSAEDSCKAGESRGIACNIGGFARD
jgi:hypothetical protein